MGYHKQLISSGSMEAVGSQTVTAATPTPASAAWPAANRAIFVPFVILAIYTVTKLWWANGTAVAGNVDCGIYDDAGNLLISTGSTAQATASVVQSVAVASTRLPPGRYYMALVMSSTSATTLRWGHGSTRLQVAGLAQQATALPLPTTFTLAAMTASYLPLFGIGHPPVI